MPIIDPEASLKLQPELNSGESLLWAGRPNFRVIFHSDDWYLVPFSLLWGGFAIFWEAGVLGYWETGNRGHDAPGFFVLWGIPFIVMGQYMIWGRFFYDAWLKRRTYYGLTTRRVLVLQESWSRKTSSIYVDAIPTITRDGERTGTIWFGPRSTVFSGRKRGTQSMSRFHVGDVPVFADIDDVDAVYQMVTDLRDKTGKTATS
jgi:hypothetical protein